MSTTAVITENTSAAVPVKRDNITFAVVGKIVEGKIVEKSVRHTSSTKEIDKLKGIGRDGKPEPYTGDETILLEQTVTAYQAGTLAGFEELVPDADERLNIINKGLSAKFNQKIRTVLIEQEADGTLSFQPVEPSYDSLSLLQEPAQRTNLSPMDRALKTITGANLSADSLKAILAQLQALATAQEVQASAE